VRITEVRIKLMDRSDDRLQAFCSITLDDAFVVRDLKIIEGSSGPFVAMPSRKLMAHCPDCGFKNHLRAAYCNQCGYELPEETLARDHDGRAKLYADIAHPVNAECREMIQTKVIEEYRLELDRAKQPGYVSRYDDEYPGDAHQADAVKPMEEARKEEAPKPERLAEPATLTNNHRIEAPAPAAQGPHRVTSDLVAHKKTASPRSKTQFGEGIF
jgi:stage V sporulation protein G